MITNEYYQLLTAIATKLGNFSEIDSYRTAESLPNHQVLIGADENDKVINAGEWKTFVMPSPIIAPSNNRDETVWNVFVGTFLHVSGGTSRTGYREQNGVRHIMEVSTRMIRALQDMVNDSTSILWTSIASDVMDTVAPTVGVGFQCTIERTNAGFQRQNSPIG